MANKKFLITFGLLIVAFSFFISAVSVNQWYTSDLGDQTDSTGGKSNALAQIGLFQLNPDNSPLPAGQYYRTVYLDDCGAFNRLRAFVVIALFLSLVGMIMAYTVTIRSTHVVFRFATFGVLVLTSVFAIIGMQSAILESNDYVLGGEYKYGAGFGLNIVAWLFQLFGTISFIFFQVKGAFEGRGDDDHTYTSKNNTEKPLSPMTSGGNDDGEFINGGSFQFKDV